MDLSEYESILMVVGCVQRRRSISAFILATWNLDHLEDTLKMNLKIRFGNAKCIQLAVTDFAVDDFESSVCYHC
jgi:hypothetical protein